MLILGLAAVGEIGWIAWQWREVRHATARFENLRREHRTLASAVPTPTAENAEKLNADLARVTALRDGLKAVLKSRPLEAAADASVPRRPLDGYFDIAAFEERMRERARANGVGLDAREHFGFAEFASAGPEPEVLATIFRQRMVLETLLSILFESRPNELVAVQRRFLQPSGKSLASAVGAVGRSTGSGSDCFELDPRYSLRVPNAVETMGFRIVFTGETRSLRGLLNRLATAEGSLIVREVEVEPVAFAEPTPGDPPNQATQGVSVVRSHRSRFTVTVESIELEDAVAPPVS